jgi:hypothetical protein
VFSCASPYSPDVTIALNSTKVRVFKYKSRFFHAVNFEFDATKGISPILSFDTGSHRNRRALLQIENLSIASVYRNAGFDVSVSSNGDIVPIREAHDAKDQARGRVPRSFLDSFIKDPPAGDPESEAFVKRMIFWTACHEMGHSFNLAHSWQKLWARSGSR